MEIDGGWVPVPLEAPEPLRQALALVSGPDGTNAEVIARFAPVAPPLVEQRRRFGRSTSAPAPWQVTVVHWSDEAGEGEFDLTLVLPPGPPLAQRVGLPAEVRVTEPAPGTVQLAFPSSASPALVATALASLVRPAFGELGGWQVCVEDNRASVGD